MLNKINAALLKLVRPISAGQLDLNQTQQFQKFKVDSASQKEKGRKHSKEEPPQTEVDSSKSSKAPEEIKLTNPPELLPDWKQALRRNKEAGTAFEPILQLFSILGKSRHKFKQWLGKRVYGDVKEQRRRASSARKGVLVDQNAD